MKTIKLGATDFGQLPANPFEFLAPYHPFMSEAMKNKLAFRDEGNQQWRIFTEVEGENVHTLQTFLRDAGFMPTAKIDGIFGYHTLAGLRLFQEYVRTVDGKTSIGKPDGIAGPNTWKHIEEWKAERTETPEFVCRWNRYAKQPSENYLEWIELLGAAKNFYLSDKNPILEMTDQFPQSSDTIPVADWNVSTDQIHLVGIRRNEENEVGQRRENDDLFVLLIHGMVFYFWGSTDPNPGMTSRTDIPFLTEGQHLYTFGWHKVSDMNKVYQALRPASNGVLVFRDRNANRAFDLVDLVSGLDTTPNPTINIHWSGIGKTNFSAGCQVIAGQSYLNDLGKLVDCSHFASVTYGDLGHGKTRGAYNVLSDLILNYAPAGVHQVHYTLGRDETSFLSPTLNSAWIGEKVGLLKDLVV